MDLLSEQKKVHRRAKAKKAYVIIATVLGSVSLILMTLSIKIGGDAAFWLRFPILIFCLILIILYVAIFGLVRAEENWDIRSDRSLLNPGIELPEFLQKTSSKKPYREDELV